MFHLVVFLALPAVLAAQLGYRDTPIIPGQPCHVHDPGQPHPHMVALGAQPGDPPSDAIILFDGKEPFQVAAPRRIRSARKVMA